MDVVVRTQNSRGTPSRRAQQQQPATFQPSANNYVEHSGTPVGVQMAAGFSAHPPHKPATTGVHTATRPRKPKGGNGGRHNPHHGAALPSATTPHAAAPIKPLLVQVPALASSL